MKSSSDFLILKFPPLLTLNRVSEEEEIFEEAFEEVEEIEEVFEEMSEETMNTCIECKFSNFDKETSFVQCRANPPVIIERVFFKALYDEEDTTFDEASYHATAFPVVSPGQWCGKWEKK